MRTWNQPRLRSLWSTVPGTDARSGRAQPDVQAARRTSRPTVTRDGSSSCARSAGRRSITEEDRGDQHSEGGGEDGGGCRTSSRRARSPQAGYTRMPSKESPGIIVHLPNDVWDQGLCALAGTTAYSVTLFRDGSTRDGDRPVCMQSAGVAAGTVRGAQFDHRRGMNDQAGGGWKMEGLCPAGRAAGSSGAYRRGVASASAAIGAEGRSARSIDRSRQVLDGGRRAAGTGDAVRATGARAGPRSPGTGLIRVIREQGRQSRRDQAVEPVPIELPVGLREVTRWPQPAHADRSAPRPWARSSTKAAVPHRASRARRLDTITTPPPSEIHHGPAEQALGESLSAKWKADGPLADRMPHNIPDPDREFQEG